MQWLYQNWVWIILFAIGCFVLMPLMMHRHGKQSGDTGNAMGDGHGFDGHRHDSDNRVNTQTGARENALDPVSKRELPANATISSVYHDRAYYFESRENRNVFESDPEKYLAGSPAAGEMLGSSGASTKQSQHRHGCC